MELVANNPHRMRDIAEKVGQIVEREARDMWELGALLCEARAICDDSELSAAEGLEGKTGDKRFGKWLSNSAFFAELKEGTRKNAINLHKTFGHRRESVKDVRLSVLTEISEPRNKDIVERFVSEYPERFRDLGRPMYIKEMRDLVKDWRTPANTDTSSDSTSAETTTTTTATTQQTETSPNLPEASWDDLLKAVNITTETVEQASQDMMHPQYMVARRLTESKERIVKAMTPLSKQERKKSLNAVVDVLAHEQEVFQAEVKALMPKYNKELEAKLKHEIEEQKKVTAQLRKQVGAGFSRKDFQYIRGVLHSDREVSTERKEKAFDLFLKLEPLFN